MSKNWAISIGINQYDNLQPMNFAKRDAEAMAAWFREEAKFDQVFLFTEDSPPINTSPPIPTQPTYGRLRRFLQAQFEQPLLEPGDNLWFFFAGHGMRHADKDYLMLADSDPGAIEHTAISVEYITERLRRSRADNVVLLLDACREESSRSGLGIGEQKHQGVITFYSCTANQKSWEIAELQHGSFTYTLLKGLRLHRATVERLDRYLNSAVPKLNIKYQKPIQNPYLKAEPPYKIHYILLEQSATLKDVETLKVEASEAENEGNLDLADQLWIRVLRVSRADSKAVRAIKRIAIKKNNSIEKPVPLKVNNPQSIGLSRGDEYPQFLLKEFFETVTVDKTGKIVNQENHQAAYFKEDLGNGITLDMVQIPGGSFMMGSPESEKGRSQDESPQHQVNVPGFSMGKFVVTQEQYQQIMGKNPSYFTQKGAKRPVEQVSWNNAVDFCQKLSQKTGREYRLPSEAEWEYACRAGTTTPFHFGETITTELANYNGTYTYASEPKGKYLQETTDVGSFPPNAFGLYDMHGNVWEWCQDDWHDNYSNAPKDGSVWTSQSGIAKLLRGGSWYYAPYYCRSAYRNDLDLLYLYNNFGFRVVCTGAART
ncbi:SUMF1/EgtB/PvdO family nonheme iron enzyme [Dolichospermum sp. FACHB-1091]|uniref:SUMF1/EgtB/PvdO family nonheme iron enzyme n=1 Tax=Dolichospermum sp. FACHB-1091 TaxID=2692798 RepID=UPI001680D9EF|nr:SUMF1/EgtB/PvdO family nonheme iron enzyme [Dolichospermum sp. FACHB-1091]MBD2444728.1 SUMF1/EgtB/PvdO family nonheme iron enzyme [Dolichospermum sp. FACHB-1091]